MNILSEWYHSEVDPAEWLITRIIRIYKWLKGKVKH